MHDALDEIITLVDADDVETGGASKARVHAEGLLHRAFSIFIFNARGELLLQRRALGKYHSPGLWTNTCCGHPRLGEALGDAAARRLGEELGLSSDLAEIGVTAYRTAFDNGLVENEIVHLLAGRGATPSAPDPAEVMATRWICREALLAEIAQKPQDFTYWFKRYLADSADLIFA